MNRFKSMYNAFDSVISDEVFAVFSVNLPVQD